MLYMIWKGGRPGGNSQGQIQPNKLPHTCQVQVNVVIVTLTNRREYV